MNFSKVYKDWKLVLNSLLHPLVSIPLVITILALIIANSVRLSILSLLLQIIATVLFGVAMAFFSDEIRKFLGKDALEKKGVSAIRHLHLTRDITNNISNRCEDGGSTEEIKNLLTILGDSVGNAIQEWGDVFPKEVKDIEEIYVQIKNKERDLALLEKRNQELESILNNQELEKEERDKLVSELDKKIKIAFIYLEEINKLEAIKNIYTAKLSSGGIKDFNFSTTFDERCTKCRNYYYLPLGNPELGLCFICDSQTKNQE